MQVLIANITLTLAVLVKLVNIGMVWILLFVAMSILIILAMYTIKERSKIRQRQASNRKTQQK
jgi:hypothetical protein